MANTAHLALTLVEQAQAQKEVTVNQAFTRLDALLNTGAKSRTTNTPPGSPSTGDLYIVGSSPTGAWAGQAAKLAYFEQTWKFITPNEGMTLWVNDEDLIYIYSGSSWVPNVLGSVNTQSGTTYILAASDLGKEIYCTSASAVTLTLPNSLPVGFNCAVIQAAAGQITFSAAGGANRRNRQSHTKSAGQWAVCSLLVVTNSGGSAAEYILSGDTAA